MTIDAPRNSMDQNAMDQNAMDQNAMDQNAMDQNAMDPLEPTRVRLSDSGQLIAALPLLIGHRPRESAVLVVLRQPRHRVVLTMRVDLPPAGFEAQLARSFVLPAVRAAATAAVLVVWTERLDGDRLGVLAAAVADELGRVTVTLGDVLVVRDGRWRSLGCTDVRCCPPQGLAVPEPDATLAAHEAVEGRVVLPDRDALVASVAGPTGADADRLRRKLRRARRRPVEDPGLILDAALRTFGDGGRLDEDTALRCIVALDDVTVRDGLLVMQSTAPSATILALLLELSRLTPPPYDDQVAATLACAAYLMGEGALANVALDRALATSSAHRLANIVATALHHGIPPEEMRAAILGPDGE